MRAIDSPHKITPRKMILRQETQNFSIFASIHIYFPESGSGKHFQASGMHTIDSPHEITPGNMILREKFQHFSIFASIHTTISLNQGQGSIFKLRKCAQSISEARFFTSEKKPHRKRCFLSIYRPMHKNHNFSM